MAILTFGRRAARVAARASARTARTQISSVATPHRPCLYQASPFPSLLHSHARCIGTMGLVGKQASKNEQDGRPILIESDLVRDISPKHSRSD